MSRVAQENRIVVLGLNGYLGQMWGSEEGRP
jgi:hypothetical protein